MTWDLLTCETTFLPVASTEVNIVGHFSGIFFYKREGTAGGAFKWPLSFGMLHVP